MGLGDIPPRYRESLQQHAAGTAGIISADAEAYIRNNMQLDPRPLTPEDIAYTAAFLASDLSLGVTAGNQGALAP